MDFPVSFEHHPVEFASLQRADQNVSLPFGKGVALVKDEAGNYQSVYPYRGPLSTSGIPAFRNNEATRAEFAAWRIEVGNDGWIWPANAPYSTVQGLVDNGH